MQYELIYYPENADQWLKLVRENQCWQKYASWYKYMEQLQELIAGTVSDNHLALNKSFYDKVPEMLKIELDEYIQFLIQTYCAKSSNLAKVYYSRIMVFLGERGLQTISDITYADLPVFYWADLHCSSQTRYVYLSHARKMLSFSSKKGLCRKGYNMILTDVRKISIKKFLFADCTHDFLLDYLTGCAETTCNNRLAAIRAYLWYIADGDVSMQSIALSASNVPFLKEPRVTRKIISEFDFAALHSAPPNTKFGIRDKTLMILLHDSAARVTELLDLNVSSLNLMTSTPYIKIHGKGGKERVVVINDKTVDHLKLYIRHFHPKVESDCPLF